MSRFRVPPKPVLIAALVSLLAPCANAGIFGNNLPVPQWGLDAYKTHTPDYAKDAPAVLLFDEFVETIDSQGRAVEHERKAVRILAAQGRDHAFCNVWYDVDEKVNYFHEWTIGADEKQYRAKETDFYEQGDPNIPVMLSTEKARIVRPPAADPGAVVICESEEVLRSYMHQQVWEFQTRIPAVYQALELDLSPGQAYFASWHRYPAQTPVQVEPNHWRWEVKDMKELDLRDIKATLS